jgi:hypothetical protein
MTPPRLSPILDDHSLDRLLEQINERRSGWNKNELMKIVAPILISALVAWGAVNIRVAVLETRVDELRSNITEIRADVKSLLRMQGESR